MANPILFGSGIDLDQSEILRLVLQKSTSLTRPATPVEGQMTFDTDDGLVYTFHSGAWSSGANLPDATALVKGVIKLAGDLGGTAASPSVAYVGGATAASIASAASAQHTQNTDTGTTSQTFQIQSGSSGFKIKNVSGEAQFRNAADNAFTDVRCRNLYVTGNVTEIDSNQVNIGDNIIELNSDILDNASNSEGGVEVKCLKADVVGAGTISSSGTVVTGVGTAFLTAASVGDILVFGAQRRRIESVDSDTQVTIKTAFSPEPSGQAYSLANQANARISFDPSTGLWKVNDGVVTAPTTFNLARKISFQIGDNSAKVFTLTHNMNSRELAVTIRQTASPYSMVLTDVAFTSVNTLTVSFNKTPTSNQYTVTIAG